MHLTWVESHATALGAFDINYCYRGTDGWIELKAGPGTEIRASQIQWAKERISAGGWPLFLVQWEDVFMILPASRAPAVGRHPTRENIEAMASTVWEKDIDPSEFIEVLFNPRKEYGKFAIHPR